MSFVFRSEGDLVLAANQAQDLSSLVRAYLEMYKKHAQGINGVKIPTSRYDIVFMPLKFEHEIAVKLVFSRTETWTEPVYYDVDDDNFSESWGSDNVSHHVTKSSTNPDEIVIRIPCSHLLLAQEQMEDLIIKQAAKYRADEAEQQRLDEIKRHEAEIERLKGGT